MISLYLNTIEDVIFSLKVKEDDYIFNFINASGLKKTGLKLVNFIGLSVNQIIPQPSLNIVLKKYEEAIKTRKIVSWEETTKYPSGLKTGKVSIAPIFNSDGKCIQLIGSINDLTERNSREMELISAKNAAEESDQLKTEFIQNLSHEIRTPLNAILGFSDLLNEEISNTKKQKHYVTIIKNNGDKLKLIIDDLLEISLLGAKQIVAVENKICLNDLILKLFEIVNIKEKENKISIYFKKGFSNKYSFLLTDETILFKILSKLFENALKYTNEGFIEVGYRQFNNKLEIYLKDTGIGIDIEEQEKIFEPFSQVEKELSKNVGGLGLGLSIAKENAKLLGGNITLKSKKGVGSKFILTIPYKKVDLETEKSN